MFVPRVRTQLQRLPVSVESATPLRGRVALNSELLARLTVRPVVVAAAPLPMDAQSPREESAYSLDGSGNPVTPRVSLRRLRAQDADAFIEVARRSRHRVGEFLPIYEPGEDDRAMFDRQLAAATEGDRHGHAWRRVIELREPSPSIIGCVHLNAIQRGMTFDADLALWVDSVWEGRGLASEACRAALMHAVADLPSGLGLHRIHAGIAPTNVRSAAMAMRLGFKRDAQKQSMLRVGERWERHDFYVFDAPM